MSEHADEWYLILPVRSGMNGVEPPAPALVTRSDLLGSGLPGNSLWGHWEAYRIDGAELHRVGLAEYQTVRYEIVDWGEEE